LKRPSLGAERLGRIEPIAHFREQLGFCEGLGQKVHRRRRLVVPRVARDLKANQERERVGREARVARASLNVAIDHCRSHIEVRSAATADRGVVAVRFRMAQTGTGEGG
jgi:hypothetical protein